MKKVLIIILVSISYIGMSQQYSRHDDNTHIDKGFESKINIAYGNGVGDYKNNLISMDVIAGYRFSPFYSMGIGASLVLYLPDNYKHVPIYMNMQINFSKSVVSPYIGLDAGYTYGRNADNEKGGVGAYLKPNAGLNIKLSNSIALDLGFGYRTQFTRIKDYSTNYKDIKLNSFTFNVGIIF